jgi:hypothetical protein
MRVDRSMTMTPLPSPAHTVSLGALAISSWSQKTKLAVGATAGFAVIVLIALLGSRSGDSEADATSPTTPRIGPPSPLTVVPVIARPSKLAKQAQELMERGDPQATIALLEAARGDMAADPDAQLQLGHAYGAVGRLSDALGEYKLAVMLDDDLRGDAKLRANVGLAADSSAGEAMIAGVEFQALFLQDEVAKSRLATIATSDKRLAVRKRARELAEKHGVSSQVDQLTSYSLDLDQEPTCEAKRDAIAKLLALRDKRAMKPIKRARDRRRGGFLGFGSRRINACLIKDADAALAELKALPK